MNANINISANTWQNYLDNQETFSNDRLYPDNISFWDAILSEDADFTKKPEGKKIAELIRDL